MGFGGSTPALPMIAVPEHLLETVSSLVADPEAFMDAVSAREEALGTCLIEVSPGTWIDPTRVVAVTAKSDDEVWVYLRGMAGHVALGGSWDDRATPEGVLERIDTARSEWMRRD